MKYILVLGIKYKKYKRPATINLHIGDRLIDSFSLYNDQTHVENIAKHTETHWLHKFDKLKWIDHIYGPICMPVGEEMPKFFKVYTLDDKALEGKIKIGVENSNNDWANGFMKNTSLIMFSIVALFPKSLTHNKCETFVKTLVRFDKSNKRTVEDPTCVNTWPVASHFNVKYINNKKNTDKIYNDLTWLGGSFIVELDIRKKHKVKYVGSMLNNKDVGQFNLFTPKNVTLATCKPLLNIYNEDK